MESGDKTRAMAEGPDPFAKLKEQVTCPVCLEVFTQPKLLACNHSFCMGCINQLKVDGDNKKMCPLCRKPTTLPSNGSAGLRPAFHINTLMELRKVIEQNLQAVEQQKNNLLEVLGNVVLTDCLLYHSQMLKEKLGKVEGQDDTSQMELVKLLDMSTELNTVTEERNSLIEEVEHQKALLSQLGDQKQSLEAQLSLLNLDKEELQRKLVEAEQKQKAVMEYFQQKEAQLYHKIGTEELARQKSETREALANKRADMAEQEREREKLVLVNKQLVTPSPLSLSLSPSPSLPPSLSPLLPLH